MKHLIQLFLVIQCCIAINRSVAMEENPKKQTNSITEITCIKKPQYAQYLHNGHVVISGEDGCSIIDPKTDKKVKKLCTLQSEKIVAHPNQTLFALLHYGNTISIYDTKKDVFIWKKTVEGSFKRSLNPYDRVEQIKFNPHDSTIFIIRAIFDNYEGSYHEKYAIIPYDYKMTQYNYITDQEDNSIIGYNAFSPLIAINPVQNEICTVHPGWITFHQTNTVFSNQDPRAYDRCGKYYKTSCEYNLNGSYMAQGDYQSSIYIINSQDPQQYECFKPKCTSRYERTDLKNILFYSNSILATISSLFIFNQENDITKRRTIASYTILSYWDIHTKELIYKRELLDTSKTHNISFSLDKTNVIITLQDKCVMLPVPSNVMYKDITKKQFFYLLFALNNYTHDGTAILPELIRLITTTVHETYKKD